MKQGTGSSSSPPPPSSAASATWTQAYGDAWYWDNRYSKDLSASEAMGFDWYQKYSSLAPIIRLYVALHNRVLVVGCGNSAFSEGMLDDGYQEIVNIDISSVVIEAMKKKYCSRPELSYIQMDVRDMNFFQTGSFDAVIDKGTLDSILVSEVYHIRPIFAGSHLLMQVLSQAVWKQLNEKCNHDA